ncbi:MAG: lipoyl(octanoyl) transferase LipB [Thermoplasmata archaeon]|jgi:lipoate-protein ligase B
MPLVDWGRREYGAALEEMRRLRRERRAGRIGDTLILVEHPPVVTVGVEGDDGAAAATGLPVVRVERGGKATYHGPGQLVGYAVVDLEPRGRDVRRFVHGLEELVVRALTPWSLPANRVPGRRGVWIDGCRKIASVGIAVEEWVTFHGFALNVSTDLGMFARFRPCGFSGEVMTSMERELERPVPLDAVRTEVARAWAELFEPGSELPPLGAAPLPGPGT